MMKADLSDSDFMQRMEDEFGMDERAVGKMIERLKAEQLSDLNDALASNDTEAVKRIIGSVDTDEDVNPLFRGKDVEGHEASKKKRHRVSSRYQFGIGDDVHVPKIDPETGDELRDPKTGEPEFEDGTVYLPNGPDLKGKPMIGVKVEGKPRMVARDKVRKLDEAVLGMVGVPNLQRMKKLAGIQSSGDATAVEIEPVETADTSVAVPQVQKSENWQAQPQPAQVGQPDEDAAQQINTAFDAIEATLPCVRLADLKSIRQRLATLQSMLNEGHGPMGRARKL